MDIFLLALRVIRALYQVIE